MLTDDLYSTALLRPATSSNTLLVVSGYASAAFARRHMEDLQSLRDDVRVRLIVGMPGSRNDHLAFVDLHSRFPGLFEGHYFESYPPVHSKVYGWFDDKVSSVGFAGSANYSQNAFFETQQRNQLSAEDPSAIRDLFDRLLPHCVSMPAAHIALPVGHSQAWSVKDAPPGSVLWEIPDFRVRISFLDRTGNVPERSGLNWGQRAVQTRALGTAQFVPREPNQAYLSLKKDSRKPGFLPSRAIRFSLVTDDGKSFDCVRAQDGDKAIHSTDNNSLLGLYIRDRIGVSAGALVTRAHLDAYGRTDYTIEKLDDETFLLSLRV